MLKLTLETLRHRITKHRKTRIRRQTNPGQAARGYATTFKLVQLSQLD
jgi:hypothetical protein